MAIRNLRAYHTFLLPQQNMMIFLDFLQGLWPIRKKMSKVQPFFWSMKFTIACQRTVRRGFPSQTIDIIHSGGKFLDFHTRKQNMQHLQNLQHFKVFIIRKACKCHHHANPDVIFKVVCNRKVQFEQSNVAKVGMVSNKVYCCCGGFDTPIPKLNPGCWGRYFKPRKFRHIIIIFLINLFHD